MKAAVRSQYVPPGVLSIQEIDKPIPKDNEVLIRVYAASVSRTDNHVLTGRPSPWSVSPPTKPHKLKIITFK